ncbi:ras-related protein Rab-26 isoform X2 [Nannospalax galili]|uniref:ras-related protein Rab-26 isoform X2 n=1 Tax=Nannospalax galili TaxID=1026970 RepID=UPI00111C8C57|nr:ras-related protein Rab-26 isoform X2 [Nannospalax galili]
MAPAPRGPARRRPQFRRNPRTSWKKTPKSKGGSVPAASALPATNGSLSARPGTTRPGRETPPNGPPQSGRPSLGGSGDFYDVAFKVMLVGDSGVGKTCLLVRFKDGAFLAGTFISTVGIDFRNKVLEVDGVKVKLQIWDTAGQERFRSVTHAYYRDAHALLLLYDVTNKASFDNIQGVLGAVTPGLPPSGQHPAGSSCLQEYGLPFMETSAKTGLNVDLAFTAIAKELKQRSVKAPSEPRFQLHDYVKREGQGASCCRP